jgi:Flp pilus assembly protein TadG
MLTLLRNRKGLAGLEFAIVSPVLLLILMGVVDLSRAILMARRLQVAADDVATIASTEAVQTSSLNTLSGYQAYAATTAPFALFPNWISSQYSSGNSFAITLTEVNFTKTSSSCTTNCSYTANVSWSVANFSGQAQLRSCGTLTSVPNGSATSLSTLPAGNFGPTSVLIADVSQVYTPLFTSIFVGSFTLKRSAYVSPRANNAITLQAGFPGPFVMCPGA